MVSVLGFGVVVIVNFGRVGNHFDHFRQFAAQIFRRNAGVRRIFGHQPDIRFFKQFQERFFRRHGFEGKTGYLKARQRIVDAVAGEVEGFHVVRQGGDHFLRFPVDVATQRRFQIKRTGAFRRADHVGILQVDEGGGGKRIRFDRLRFRRRRFAAGQHARPQKTNGNFFEIMTDFKH